MARNRKAPDGVPRLSFVLNKPIQIFLPQQESPTKKEDTPAAVPPPKARPAVRNLPVKQPKSTPVSGIRPSARLARLGRRSPGLISPKTALPISKPKSILKNRCPPGRPRYEPKSSFGYPTEQILMVADKHRSFLKMMISELKNWCEFAQERFDETHQDT